MNIEERFILKAIEERNYISFMYENRSFQRLKPLKLHNHIVHTDRGTFEKEKLKKLTVLKERF